MNFEALMLKSVSLRCAAALIGALVFGGSANAASWKFKVYNKSNTAAVEFRTQEDGEWSSNWISDRIEPGDYFDMDFGTDKGDCTVRTQIRSVLSKLEVGSQLEAVALYRRGQSG